MLCSVACGKGRAQFCAVWLVARVGISAVQCGLWQGIECFSGFLWVNSGSLNGC